LRIVANFLALLQNRFVIFIHRGTFPVWALSKFLHERLSSLMLFPRLQKMNHDAYGDTNSLRKLSS
jgi:hypothetical protein